VEVRGVLGVRGGKLMENIVRCGLELLLIVVRVLESLDCALGVVMNGDAKRRENGVHA
jgi:hypothetical protein